MPGLPIFPDQASLLAPRVDMIFWFLTIMSVIFGVVIVVMALVFVVKYRRRDESYIPTPVHGNTKMELGWIFGLTLLAIMTFFWAATVYVQNYDAPADSMEVWIIGRQWMWKAIHPEGPEEINELHIPVNTPVRLQMISQDVIHSFFIPDFRTKQDVLPGRYTNMWFQATKTGRFRLFCAEYCGTEHSGMIGWITVMEPAEFQQWLTTGSQPLTAGGAGAAAGGAGAAAGGAGGAGGGQTQSPAAAGEALFTQLGCNACHLPEGKGPGPSLVGVYNKPVDLTSGQAVTVDDSYLRESIVNPNAKVVQGYGPAMPTYQGRVTDAQILQLIAYIKSLEGQSAPATSGR